LPTEARAQLSRDISRVAQAEGSATPLAIAPASA